MNSRRFIAISLVFWAMSATLPSSAWAAKVLLNPSNQMSNPVKGGGVEGTYALINANLAAAKIKKAGISVKVDQDFYNAPKNANSWGANIFVSVHSNAGGGHGTETLYKTTAGKAIAAKVQNAMLANMPYKSRGLKHRTDLYVLNSAKMAACLAEVVFHDCAVTSGQSGHPPSESAFIRSKAGQDKIATGIAAGVCAHFGKTCGAGGVVISPPKTGTLKGVVYRYPNAANRIAGAAVKMNTGQKTTSSTTGFWQFSLKPGTYTATATKSGFKPGSKATKVQMSQIVWGSIGLKVATVVADKDKDGIPDSQDNCPNTPNKSQKDYDKDGKGDACDPPPPDQDKDGVPDSQDNCPNKANKDQKDSNKDGIGDVCQPPVADKDKDGVPDSQDNCPNTANPGQQDSNNNGLGDACDPAKTIDAGSTDTGATAGVDAGGAQADGGSDSGAASPSDVAAGQGSGNADGLPLRDGGQLRFGARPDAGTVATGESAPADSGCAASPASPGNSRSHAPMAWVIGLAGLGLVLRRCTYSA